MPRPPSRRYLLRVHRLGEVQREQREANGLGQFNFLLELIRN